MGRKINEDDPFYSALLKLIPSEIIAVYLAILPFLTDLNKNNNYIITWGISILFVIVTPLWLFRFTNISEGGISNKEIIQLVASTISMIVWIFALGGPFETQSWYTENATLLVPIVLIIWTGLIAPLLLGKKPELAKD